MVAEVRGHVSDIKSCVFYLWHKGEEHLCQRHVHTCFEGVLTGDFEHLREGEGVYERMEGLDRWERE